MKQTLEKLLYNYQKLSDEELTEIIESDQYTEDAKKIAKKLLPVKE